MNNNRHIRGKMVAIVLLTVALALIAFVSPISAADVGNGGNVSDGDNGGNVSDGDNGSVSDGDNGGNVSDGDNGGNGDNGGEPIPEFTTILLPIVALLGLVAFYRRKQKK